MAQNILFKQLNRLTRKERRAYLVIALIILVVAASTTFGPVAGRVAGGTKLSAWCGIAKENIQHYTKSGMTCGLWREGDLIRLLDVREKYENLYCELVCYDCDVETSTRGLEVCSADSAYIKKPSDVPAIDQKTDTPEYGAADGDDAFTLSWVNTPKTAYRNEKVPIIVKVQNQDMVRGKMKVQCSMLDPKVHTWLMQAMEVENAANCVRGEPFTETKIVTLGAGETSKVSFTPIAPNEVGKYMYFCEAFERCAKDYPDAGVSSTLKGVYMQVKERPAQSDLVDPDSKTTVSDGDGFKFENPFEDLTTWWAKRNVLQKFLVIFSSVFVILLLVMIFGGKKQPTL